jgi:hypothetical protein
MSQDRIVTLDSGRFGLLSAPSGQQGDGVCLLLFNAGFIHRSGPFRLHTRLARQLAHQGVASFRFDAPGVGDAIERSDTPLVKTMQASMDVLQSEHGFSRFVVGGLCSAADLGWQVALADPRVVGVLSIDGLVRKGFWYRYAKMRRALRKSPADWFRALLRRAQPRPALNMTDADLRDWPAPGIEREQFAVLVRRGVALFHLFTGGASYFLHRRQFRETFGLSAASDLVEFHHWPECDHTFFGESDRSRLIETIGHWMTQHYRSLDAEA